jgi:uncharacterized protein
MAGPKTNGHAGRNGAQAFQAPDVHPATFNTKGASSGNGKKNGKGKGKSVPTSRAHDTVQYNCAKCPGYCCSYPVITVTKYDLERLAKHFGLAPAEAEKRFTKSAHGYKRIMRRKADEHYGKVCRFFDTDERRCTIYTARPSVCRAFPGSGRCGYYDFLSFERRAQNDPEFVAATDHG